MEAKLKELTADRDRLLQSIEEMLNKDVPRKMTSPGTGVGLGGAILFNSHYAAYTKKEEYYYKAEQLLNTAYKTINLQTYKASFSTNFYRDINEFGYLLGYLVDHHHLDEGDPEIMEKIDILLADRLAAQIGKGNFGIADGAIGIGFYFIRRKDNRLAADCLSLIADALVNTRMGDQTEGYYWVCNYFHEPRVYTGISHGNAMVINFLATLYETGLCQEICEELIYYATHFLFRNKVKDNQSLAAFPLWIGQKKVTNNHGLVYGDLGTAYALIKGAKVLKNALYLNESIEVAMATTTRTEEEDTLIKDASIFYGASAPYLLYQSIYEQTGRDEFNRASDYWAGQIPAMATQNEGYVGFSSHFYTEEPAIQLSFNFGITGIGLAMIQSLSKGQYKINEFAWMP